MESREHRITEVLAYYIYLAEGCPEGRATQHWLKAEQELEAIDKAVKELGKLDRTTEPKPRIFKRHKNRKTHGKDSPRRRHKHK